MFPLIQVGKKTHKTSKLERKCWEGEKKSFVWASLKSFVLRNVYLQMPNAERGETKAYFRMLFASQSFPCLIFLFSEPFQFYSLFFFNLWDIISSELIWLPKFFWLKKERSQRFFWPLWSWCFWKPSFSIHIFLRDLINLGHGLMEKVFCKRKRPQFIVPRGKIT